jgi:hypothetical protein
MRRGSRSPTGFPDSSWGGEGQGSSAGVVVVVAHINCLRLTILFLSLFSSLLSLLLLLCDAPSNSILSGYGVTFFSFDFNSLH